MRIVPHFLALGAFLWVVPAAAWAQETRVPSRARPDSAQQEVRDTLPVDSTLLLIQEQLKGLARPPGVDSTYFLPDSLLPDSLRELREARRPTRAGERARAPAPRPGLTGGDTILAALQALADYTVTEYQATGADFGAKERRLILRGTPDAPARLIVDGQELTADSALVYSEETRKVWSLGSEAVFQPPDGDPVTSRVIVFDLDQERGSALDAHTRYSGGADWLVHGDLTSVSEAASYGNRLSFTSCELEEPHYHFAADNVKIVRDNIMVARPVKLYFADVPVAWLPFMAQSLSRGRASGLLTPTFSVNDIVRTSKSYRRRISNLGFYWAMSDYYDATVFLDWWSGEHLALTGSFRYNWARQFLDGGLNFRRFWREEGGSELAFDAHNSWQISERTNFRFRTRYASSTSFVRRTSFDPREVVQSIDSEGGLSHRFGFGNLSLSANRRQFLSDDRVEMTLPNLSFSLTPVTFLKASPSQARFYNNITWSGSASFRRSIYDRAEQPDTAVFSPSNADQVKTNASLNTGLSLGNFSISSGFTLSESATLGVPVELGAGEVPLEGVPLQREDQAQTDLTWNASIGYQQRLIGATTLTPSLSLSSRMFRSDADSLAHSFVSAPTRVSLGVNLRTDLYGFFGGFGPFEAIRHKISPGFDFSYAPKVSPTELQTAVFGASEVGAVRTLRISLNQTFEAKRRPTTAAAGAGPGAPVPGQEALLPDTARLPADTIGLGSPVGTPDSLAADSTAGPRSQEDLQKVTLLALRTTAVSYDFERAKAQGDWLWGITTTRLTNTISSDYLRGLNLTIAHDLFEDETDTGGGGGGGAGSSAPKRKFSPHLSQMNFSFSLDSRSLPFRLLRSLLGGGEESGAVVEVAQPAAGAEEEENPFAPALSDESTIIPQGDGPGRPGGAGRARTGGGGGWRASFSYSLQRPRSKTLPSNQMLQGNLSFSPTEKWEVSWRTSYDLAEGSFNDHLIRLTRDLHRWQAYFDFRQTATGNWSFRFEVALTDNEDLHFDYQQRSIQDQTGVRRF